MGTIDGSASTEIGAPIATVYAITADVEGVTRWQPEIKAAACLERDGEGAQTLVHMKADAKVRTLGAAMRFSYEPPIRIGWKQEDGPLKSIEGSWEFEDLGDGRTGVTFQVEVDLGRTLGMLIRGPIVGVLKGKLLYSMPEKLKRFIESDGR